MLCKKRLANQSLAKMAFCFAQHLVLSPKDLKLVDPDTLVLMGKKFATSCLSNTFVVEGEELPLAGK